jgi:hypothetical protein
MSGDGKEDIERAMGGNHEKLKKEDFVTSRFEYKPG